MAKEDSKIQWLLEQMPMWQNKGIIDNTTAGEIAALYPEPKNKLQSLAMLVFSAIGAVIIGLGVVLLFAYNWQDMSKAAKLQTIFGALIASHCFGVGLFFNSKRFKAVGRALCLLGTMLFGAGILLIAQIYHINEHFPNAFLIWGIGAFIMAWTMPAVEQAMLAAILFTIWAMAEGIAFGTAIPFIYLFLVGLVPLAYINKNRLLLAVLLVAASVATVFVVSANYGEMVFYSLLSLFAVYIAFGFVHQKYGSFENFAPLYDFIGKAGYFITLFIMCFNDVAEEIIDDVNLFADYWAVVYWLAPLVLAVAGWGIVAKILFKKAKLNYWRYDLMLIPLLLIFFLCFSFSPAKVLLWPLVAVFNLVFLAHCLMLIADGCINSKIKTAIVGSLLLAALAWARFIDLFDSLALRGVVFVIVGAVIFGQGFFYAKVKRDKALKEK